MIPFKITNNPKSNYYSITYSNALGRETKAMFSKPYYTCEESPEMKEHYDGVMEWLRSFKQDLTSITERFLTKRIRYTLDNIYKLKNMINIEELKRLFVFNKETDCKDKYMETVMDHIYSEIVDELTE